MEVVACFPQPSPLPLLDSVCCRNFKYTNPKPFGPPLKLGGRSPALTVKAGSQTSSTTSTEIRVCVNRTCRRQGSNETLQTLSGIAPPDVSVKSCGCLGRCGSGPNLVVLPQGTFLGHCGTAARAAEAMSYVCGGDSNSWSDSLAALALRTRAQDELGKGNVAEALLLLSQAINLRPCGGIHVLHKDRSAARLAIGNIAEALDDASTALSLAPKYSEAYICQGDALMAIEQYDAAEKSYAKAAELDPSIYRSKSFKVDAFLVESVRRIEAKASSGYNKTQDSDCKAPGETYCCGFALISSG